MSKGHKRQKRPAELAVEVIYMTTPAERKDFPADDGKEKAAQSLGQRGGGARATALSASRRKEIAQKAAAMRWIRPSKPAAAGRFPFCRCAMGAAAVASCNLAPFGRLFGRQGGGRDHVYACAISIQRNTRWRCSRLSSHCCRNARLVVVDVAVLRASVHFPFNASWRM